MKIAIIGSGIAGLTAAHVLHRQHDVAVFEKDARLGGHANTLTVQERDQTRALDTGFIVYNEVTYPRFTTLLRALDVRTQPSEMTFSVQCKFCALEYSSGSLRGLFARPSHALDPSFQRMLIEIFRFNRLSRRALAADRVDGTLGDFLRRHRAPDAFVRHYITPMAGAIWSSSTAAAERFPLATFLRFFDNHGLLSVTQRTQWRTITGGSREYVDALTRSFRHRVRLRCPVDRIRRLANGVDVRCADGTNERFDKVVIATHADQGLALLADPSPAERDALGALRYQRNEAILHTDTSVLPVNRHAWSSWNHHMDDCRDVERRVSMSYYLNRLQRFDSERDYCVTLNDDGRIAPESIIARIPYEHPVYNSATAAAQQRLTEINGQRQTYFCGAYLGNGFHEDGVKAGMSAAHLLTHAHHPSLGAKPIDAVGARAIAAWQ